MALRSFARVGLRSRRTIQFATAGALLACLSSCASYSARNHLSYHVLPVGADGELGEFEYDEPPGADGKAIPRGGDLAEQVELVLGNARKEADLRCGEDGADQVPLMVAIHGGRNTPRTANARVDELLRVIHLEDYGSRDNPWSYPVFVNWRSGDFTTLWGRLSKLRQGRNLAGLGAWLSFPVEVVHDLTRGVARLPRSLLYGLFRDFSVATRVATGANLQRSWGDSDRIAHAMEIPAIDCWEEGFDIRAAHYSRSAVAHGVRLLTYFPTQLTKVPLQALVLEGLGQGAWEEMRRRASHLVRTPLAYEIDTDGGSDRDLREFYGSGEIDGAQRVDGALPLLYQGMVDSGDRYKLTLVAHSMGAIAINESLPALSKAIEDAEARIEVERMIYMAPACTVGDAADALVPFLEKHSDAQFHLLTLHPIAEADEFNLYDLVPRGSLLEWIDVYYSLPATHAERVFGKWANAVPAVGRFASVRKQVHIKAFDVEGDSYPQKHGHFFEIPFWRPSAYGTAGNASFESDWLGQECGRLEQRCRDEEKRSRAW